MCGARSSSKSPGDSSGATGQVMMNSPRHWVGEICVKVSSLRPGRWSMSWKRVAESRVRVMMSLVRWGMGLWWCGGVVVWWGVSRRTGVPPFSGA